MQDLQNPLCRVTLVVDEPAAALKAVGEGTSSSDEVQNVIEISTKFETRARL